MNFDYEVNKFNFNRTTFSGKRVLITGSGKNGGLGQGLALAALLNGAKTVGIHFNSSYRDGFEMVDKMRDQGFDVFAVQADVTNTRDLWASRGFIKEQMGGQGPDILICNSGLTEAGYRFGRALPEKENESRRERRARVRRDFIDRLEESKQVMETKIDGFMYMSHLWAGEAVYHKQHLTLIYISSMQALDPGRAVPGYVLANWAVLKLPKILDINLGRENSFVTSFSLMLPFIKTNMTEEYADNPKVFGRWQPRMLETSEVANSITNLLDKDREELHLGIFKLNVETAENDINLHWLKVELKATEEKII
tara:strand:- start:448 stop:1377 length:930 start_codon:yes stop_codon:yes gene_type:complete